MATIKSGASTDQLTVDPTSKAARATEYDASGRETSVGSKSAYMGVVAEFTPPATPSDILLLGGSATKTIRVVSFELELAQTTAAIQEIFLIKRTTADTVGTFVSDLPAKGLDSNDAAPTAVFGHYTANPTLGVAGPTIRREKRLVPVATADRLLIETLRYTTASQRLDRPVTLRGTAEQLVFNWNGAALPAGLVVAAHVVWTEE